MINNINFDSYHKAIEIFEDIHKNHELSDSKLKDYFETQGIEFLRRHIMRGSKIELEFEIFKKLFEKGISDDQSNNILVNSIRNGLCEFTNNKDLQKRYSFEKLINEAIKLANLYLPREVSSTIKLYPMYGIRGTAIVLENEIGIDFVDQSLYVDGKIDDTRLIGLLAHEIHHIELESCTKDLIERENILNTTYIEMISELLSEGTAMFYLTNPYEIETLRTETWISNMNNIEYHIDNVINYIEDFNNREHLELYDEDMIGYSVGYIMVEKIHNKYGKSKVMECIIDPRKFFDLYKSL